jgi:hypothetical protein
MVRDQREIVPVEVDVQGSREGSRAGDLLELDGDTLGQRDAARPDPDE